MFNNVFNLMAIAICMVAAPASAQTMEESSSSTFEAPYSMRDAGDSDMNAVGTRDSAMNKVVNATPKWGFTASAIGNLVNVVTTGSNNTIMVNASQINKGSQQARIGFSSDKTSDKQTEASNSTAAVSNTAVNQSAASAGGTPVYATYK